MKKNFILAPTILTLIFTTGTLAQSSHNDLYLGGQLGAGFVNVSRSTTGTLFQPPFSPSGLSGSGSMSTAGLLGGLFFGAGLHKEKLYLGLEVDADADTANQQSIGQTNTVGTARVNESLQSELSLSVIPGCFVSDATKVYGRGGFVEGVFESKSADAGLIAASGDFTQWMPGYILGLGVEHYFPNNISARLEYDHLTFAGFNRSSSSPIASGGGANTSSLITHYTISTNQVLLGVAAHV